MAFHWICPHCGTRATIQSQNYASGTAEVIVPGSVKASEGIALKYTAIQCPSAECRQFTLDVSAYFVPWRDTNYGSKLSIPEGKLQNPVGSEKFRFSPRGGAPLSAHIPTAVRDDYTEACLIKDLSPKAAATLCRRALQGMIRDFWGVVKPTLHEELNTIKTNCDQGLFDALMGIKSIGNIGAHPEKDINLIIEVDPGEVDALIEVLHVLDAEWYVDRAQRAARLQKVNQLSQVKVAAKLANVGASPAPPAGP